MGKRTFAGVDRHIRRADGDAAQLYLLGVAPTLFKSDDAAGYYNSRRHLITIGSSGVTTDR